MNIKYHILNLVAVIVFSGVASAAINKSVRYALTPEYVPPSKIQINANKKSGQKLTQQDLISSILDSGMFIVADGAGDVTQGISSGDTVDVIGNLTLLGTVTGPAVIARAVIKSNREKEPKIFALYKINAQIDNNVYGYKLTSIDIDKVILERNGEKLILELFAKTKPEQANKRNAGAASGSNRVSTTVSRAEIKQTVMNNLDNAMKGLVAGPYRKNGKLEGYVLRRVSQENVLYKFGIRSGDIVKRVNGKELNSTEKLYSMWQNMQNETKITADVERNGRMMTFDLNITE